MWVLLTKGAVSIVQFNHAPEGDPKTMQVRSRRKEWVTAFARYVETSDGRKIKFVHSDKHDYQWRFFATPEEIAAAVGRAVLDIKYSNFKNATMAPGTGLRNAQLRNGLHSAYHKVWTTLLDAGDGTSMYDHKGTAWASTTTGSGTIAICERAGHWWATTGTASKTKCSDCGTAKPAGWKQGDGLVKPTKAEVAEWWKKHPAAKRAGHVTATGTGSVSWSTEPEAGDVDTTCKGSGLNAQKSTLSGQDGTYTGKCTVCKRRVRLSTQTWTVQHHDRPLTAAEAVDGVVAQIPAPAPSVDELEANRDAAKDNYLDVEEARVAGKVTDSDVDDAITAYCQAEDAYLAATGTVLGPKASA